MGGFPALAGMDRCTRYYRKRFERLPRTRGDGPHTEGEARSLGKASPHSRGWTRLHGACVGSIDGFPALAGMDPYPVWFIAAAQRLPRTRGDGPHAEDPLRVLAQASPHSRGWTPALTAPALDTDGFPALAGMDPMTKRERGLLTRLPRTRGDGPRIEQEFALHISASPHSRGWTRARCARLQHVRGFPALAGMDPRL